MNIMVYIDDIIMITTILTEKQLFDYIKCPILYDSIHNKQIFYCDKSSFNELLNKVSSFFYLNLLNSNVVSFDVLKNKWDSICLANNLTPQKTLEGIDLINKMYRWAKNEELRILDLNSPYKFTLKFDDAGIITFKGEMSAIAIGKKNKLPYMLITDFANRYPNQVLLDMKLKYTLDSYAFKQIYNKDIGIKLHYVKDNKDFFTLRIDDDFNRLINTIKNVTISINNKLFYPRESIFCRTCGFLNFCKVWHG